MVIYGKNNILMEGIYLKNKIITSILLACTITATVSPTLTTFANTINENVNLEITQEDNSIINNVKPYVNVNNDGFIGLTDNISDKMIKEYDLEGLLKHFEYLNQQVKLGNIKINKDLSIIDLNNLVKAGSDYLNNHWWGFECGYSYSSARSAIKDLKNVAIGAGTVAGALGNILVSIGGAVTAGYCSMLANSMEHVNSGNGQRGIVVDVNWTAVYNVYSQ